MLLRFLFYFILSKDIYVDLKSLVCSFPTWKMGVMILYIMCCSFKVHSLLYRWKILDQQKSTSIIQFLRNIAHWPIFPSLKSPQCERTRILILRIHVKPDVISRDLYSKFSSIEMEKEIRKTLESHSLAEHTQRQTRDFLKQGERWDQYLRLSVDLATRAMTCGPHNHTPEQAWIHTCIHIMYIQIYVLHTITK